MASANKEELAVMKHTLRVSIGDYSRAIDNGLKLYKNAADALRAEIKKYRSREASYMKRDSAKNGAKLDLVTEDLHASYASFKDIYDDVAETFSAMRAEYTKLEDYCYSNGDRELSRVRLELARLERDHQDKLAKAERGVRAELPAILLTDRPEPVVYDDDGVPARPEPTPLDPSVLYGELNPAIEESEREESKPVAASSVAGVASVNIAPINIDVSDLIERAVSATVDKLTVAMEKRLCDYVDGLVLPTLELPEEPHVTAAAITEPVVNNVAAAANAELAAALIEEERKIYDILRATCESVKTVLEDITSLSDTYLAIAEKQKQIAALQKQTNDMQRHTMREQQGVQVNQRLVNGEQVELAAEQAVIIERQKSTTEKQKQIANAQQLVSDAQQAILDTQTAIDGTMQKVIESQKAIIAEEQALLSAASTKE